MNERIEELERRADDAAAEAAKGPTEAGERLEQRFAELEKRVSKASKARTRSGERIEKLEGRLDEIGRTQPSLEKRLAGLERALGGAVEQRLAGLEKLADEAAAGATKAEARGWRPDRAGLRPGSRPSRSCPSGLRRSASRSSRLGSSRTTCARCTSRSCCAWTELEAVEREAANGSRKLEQRVAETIEGLTARTELAEMIETLTARVDALDRRLSEAEKRSARPQEPPAAPTPEAAKPKLGDPRERGRVELTS